jgi:hypothetical protein
MKLQSQLPLSTLLYIGPLVVYQAFFGDRHLSCANIHPAAAPIAGNRGHLAAGTVIMMKSDYADRGRYYIIGISSNNT